MKFAFHLLLLLLPLNLAHAARGERWYNVEVIIFAYASDAGVREEYWPLEPGEPDTANSVSLVSGENDTEHPPGQLIEFEALPFRLLSDALNQLRRSSRHDVIYSSAWRLPGLPGRSAPAVRIKAGKRFLTGGALALPALPTTVDDDAVDDALYEIDGRIKVSLSKFLDVDADLLYRRHISEGLAVNGFRPFRLKEFRRMKSQTVHYLDHPLFGVVIGIDPYQTRQTPDLP